MLSNNTIKGYVLSLSAQLKRSAGENFQGAMLFSTLANMAFQELGALASSIIWYLRICKIIDKGSILTGHSCTQA